MTELEQLMALINEVKHYDPSMDNRYTWAINSNSPTEAWIAIITDWGREKHACWEADGHTMKEAVELVHALWKNNINRTGRTVSHIDFGRF